jgi:polysaccharide pyruvyl transferase CsaB
VRLALSGFYGAGNLGDEALLAGLLRTLRGHGIGDVTVLSLRPGATAALHDVRARHRLRGLPLALWRAEALVSGGGGLLQDATSARSLHYYLGVLRAARLLGRRVVVFGQSLGPLSPAGRAAVRSALRGVPIGLRDAPSLALAGELGLPAQAVGDTALLLDVARAAPREAVVLIPRAGYGRATEVLVDLGRRAIALGLAVESAVFQRGADELEVERLSAALPSLRLLPTPEPLTAAAALAGARLVVSARLHGLILAAASGTAHAGLSYDPKVEGFAAETSAPCWPVPADDETVGRVAAALERALHDPPLDLEALARARARAEAGVAWLVQDALHRRGRRGS